jgi:3-oxoadipate enol-lactonase
MQVLSNDLYTLIQKLNLGKVALVGHSMGGMTALIFALDHPDKVSKLVLVGTAAKVPFSMRISWTVTRHFLPYKTFMRRSVESGYFKPSEQLIENNMATALNTSKYAAYQCFAEFTAKYDIRDRIAKIKSPTLIVVGEKDKDLPVKLSQYLNREIEGSKLQIIPDSGHMVIVEKPEEFSQVLDEFIR